MNCKEFNLQCYFVNFVPAVNEADSQWCSGALASPALRWTMVKQFCHVGHTAEL